MTELQQMPLINHLEELRKKLLIYALVFLTTFLTMYYFSDFIYEIMLQPLKDAIKNYGSSQRLIYTNLPEAFSSKLKIIAFSSFLITLPFLIWQITSFIKPALFKNEIKVVIPTIITSLCLFIIGIILSYKFFIPVVWDFFLSFQSTNLPLKIALEAKISNYFSLMTSMLISSALTFQIPILIFVLVKYNLVKIKTLKKNRKNVILGSFIASAIMTPPDVFSQIILASIIVFLYELSIYVSSILENKIN